MRSSRLRRGLLALAAAAVLPTLLVGTATHAQSAPAAAPRGPSVLVIGGTITSRFSNDVGSLSQGWWSIAAHQVGATSVRTSAEGGSSITARGNKCQGTRYYDRLKYVTKVDIILVEAGEGEAKACQSDHHLASISSAERRRLIQVYMRQLAHTADRLRIPRSHVYFVSPWGPESGKASAQLRTYVKQYATAKGIGFRYISTPRLHAYQMIDRIQPNSSGHQATGRRVADAIRPVARKSRSLPPKPVGTGRSLMVMGDSITSWYSNETNSPSQGWWSILAGQLGASSVTTSAEGGSGINVRGNGCRGTTFDQRLKHLRQVDVLVVEVGRNDYKYCKPDHRLGVLQPEAQRAGIEAFMPRLTKRITELGMTPDQVYFVTPWGSRHPEFRANIPGFVEQAATAHGFTFVATEQLPDAKTLDGTHPNREGSKDIARAVLTAISTPDPEPEPEPEPEPVEP